MGVKELQWDRFQCKDLDLSNFIISGIYIFDKLLDRL